MERLNRVSLLTALLALVLLSAKSAAGQDSGQERFQHSLSLPSGGRLRVENYKGKIHIEGWDREEVTVDVYKRFEGRSIARARWLNETRVEFHTGINSARIKVEYPKHDGFWRFHDHDNGEVELIIRAPRRVNLEVDGYKPEMKISSIEGDIRIDSYKSPIDIQSTTGAIRIDTYKETIKMRDVQIQGHLSVKIYKGEVDIDAAGIGSGATFDTYKADVVLRLPESAQISLEVSGNRRANFESDFPVTMAGRLGRDEIRGAINGGGPRLRFETYSGSLVLRRR